VRVEARSGTLFPGAHEIHTIPAGVGLRTPKAGQLLRTTKAIDRMIGADISFLPEIESRAGRFNRGTGKFYEAGQEVDAISLLKRHGFNAIRLRIFVNPENPKGYAPGTGFCGLDSTLSMARRVKEAGMGLLLDFHYSDYWADPQQQNKPLAWADLASPALRDSVRSYTSMVLRALERQGTLPDMVQIGNEINHGLLWPDGHIGNLDGLAGLLKAGVEGTEAVSPRMPVMMHIALGGQNDEARFWLDNMISRGVKFDILGLSYYPRWHGTLEDLYTNLHDLVDRYRKPINVVEYSDFKRTVHQIVFDLPQGMGKGAAIWEPLGWRSGLFDREGNVTGLMTVYDSLGAEYLGGR
jgi:beta-galactosidase